MPIVAYDKLIFHDFATGDFTLVPKAGRAFEIVELGFEGGPADAIADIRIAGKPLMSLPISHNYDNIALNRGPDAGRVLFFDFLKEISPDYNSFKVSQGRTFRITSSATSGHLFGRYCEWDEPKEDFIGAVLGENSPKVPYIAYGKGEAPVAAGATRDIPISICLNPKEYMDFPYVKGVPAGRKLTLIGMCAGKGAGAGADIIFLGLKMINKDGTNVFGYEEEFAFPRYFVYPREHYARDFFRFSKPLEFIEDDEMWLTARVKNAGIADQTAVITVTMIFNCEALA